MQYTGIYMFVEVHQSFGPLAGEFVTNSDFFGP